MVLVEEEFVVKLEDEDNSGLRFCCLVVEDLVASLKKNCWWSSLVKDWASTAICVGFS